MGRPISQETIERVVRGCLAAGMKVERVVVEGRRIEVVPVDREPEPTDKPEEW